jgi:hypothetical protein
MGFILASSTADFVPDIFALNGDDCQFLIDKFLKEHVEEIFKLDGLRLR